MTPLPTAFLATPLAHRGLHDRRKGVIENSRSAVAAAVDAGYGVEIDLQLSADGEAMVFHDYHLDRLTAASGPVAQVSAADLGRLTLTDGGEGVPTLADIMDIVRGRAPLLIELKDQSGSFRPVDGRLERRVARLLSAYDGPAAVMSFNPHSVATCAKVAPATPRGRVTCYFAPGDWLGLTQSRADELNLIDDLDALGASFISHDHKYLDDPVVAKVRATGRHVLCWTTKSPADDRQARRIAENVTFENYAA